MEVGAEGNRLLAGQWACVDTHSRSTRHTSIVRTGDGEPVADVDSEWVRVRLSDGPPHSPQTK